MKTNNQDDIQADSVRTSQVAGTIKFPMIGEDGQ